MGMDGGSAKYKYHHHHPSFSSALLEEMYRSTDLDQQSTPTKCPNHQRPSPTCSSRYEAGHLMFSLNSTCTCTCSDHLKPPKPIIRLHQAEEEEYYQKHQKQHSTSQTKSKSNCKALRDFKKHPISPGRRFATFLNSLVFSTRRTNKPNYTTTNSNSANSSFSPSSLTNNPFPSPRAKRSSLRFVDQPCAHKSLHQQHETTPINTNHHISEAARNLLKTYQNKVERFTKKRNTEYEYASDDGGSDTSSDLFELHNLSPPITTATGIHKDLPLYKTTQLNSIKSCHC